MPDIPQNMLFMSSLHSGRIIPDNRGKKLSSTPAFSSYDYDISFTTELEHIRANNADVKIAILNPRKFASFNDLGHEIGDLVLAKGIREPALEYLLRNKIQAKLLNKGVHSVLICWGEGVKNLDVVLRRLKGQVKTIPVEIPDEAINSEKLEQLPKYVQKSILRNTDAKQNINIATILRSPKHGLPTWDLQISVGEISDLGNLKTAEIKSSLDAVIAHLNYDEPGKYLDLLRIRRINEYGPSRSLADINEINRKYRVEVAPAAVKGPVGFEEGLSRLHGLSRSYCLAVGDLEGMGAWKTFDNPAAFEIFGQKAADAMLTDFTRLANEAGKPYGIEVFRKGGDEFGWLGETSQAKLIEYFGRLDQRLREAKLVVEVDLNQNWSKEARRCFAKYMKRTGVSPAKSGKLPVNLYELPRWSAKHNKIVAGTRLRVGIRPVNPLEEKISWRQAVSDADAMGESKRAVFYGDQKVAQVLNLRYSPVFVKFKETPGSEPKLKPKNLIERYRFRQLLKDPVKGPQLAEVIRQAESNQAKSYAAGTLIALMSIIGVKEAADLLGLEGNDRVMFELGILHLANKSGQLAMQMYSSGAGEAIKTLVRSSEALLAKGAGAVSEAAMRSLAGFSANLAKGLIEMAVVSRAYDNTLEAMGVSKDSWLRGETAILAASVLLPGAARTGSHGLIALLPRLGWVASSGTAGAISTAAITLSFAGDTAIALLNGDYVESVNQRAVQELKDRGLYSPGIWGRIEDSLTHSGHNGRILEGKFVKASASYVKSVVQGILEKDGQQVLMIKKELIRALSGVIFNAALEGKDEEGIKAEVLAFLIKPEVKNLISIMMSMDPQSYYGHGAVKKDALKRLFSKDGEIDPGCEDNLIKLVKESHPYQMIIKAFEGELKKMAASPS